MSKCQLDAGEFSIALVDDKQSSEQLTKLALKAYDEILKKQQREKRKAQGAYIR